GARRGAASGVLGSRPGGRRRERMTGGPMETRIISQHEVYRLLPMPECIDAMAEALATLAAGDAVLPLRSMVWLPDRSGLLGLMPAYLGAPRSFGLKVVSVMPGNHGTEYDSHQGVVMLFGVDHGEPQAAVAGADLICTATAARDPVLSGAWIASGAHINAVGACFKTSRELDTAAVARARLYVDRRESALNEAGDFLIARAEGAIGDDHIRGELGAVLLGRIAGRTSPDDVTLFESLGIAIEDLAAAHRVYQRALATGAGSSVQLAGGKLAGA